MSNLYTFIRDITEAYVIDLELEIDHNQLADEFISVLKEDKDSYNYFVNLNKAQQQNFIYEYFTISFLLKNDRFFNEVESLINEIEEEFRNTPELVPLNEWTVSGALAKFSAFIASHPISSGIAGFLALLLAFRLLFPQKVYWLADKIGKLMQKVGKFLVRQGKHMTFSYTTILQNFKECYKRCGVDENQLEKPGYLTTGYGNISKYQIFRTPETVEKVKCLRECYLQIFTQTLIAVAQVYFKCLKNAGELAKIGKASSENIIQTILIYSPAECGDFDKTLKEMISHFDHLLELVYSDDIYGNEAKLLRTRAKQILGEAIAKKLDEVKFKEDNK